MSDDIGPLVYRSGKETHYTEFAYFINKTDCNTCLDVCCKCLKTNGNELRNVKLDLLDVYHTTSNI